MKKLIFTLLLLISFFAKSQDTVYIKFVYVKWEDIVNTDSGWHTLKESVDFVNTEVSIVNQVGFLLRRDEKYLILTESYFDGPDGLLGTVIRIPICNIKEYYVIAFKSIPKKDY